MVRRLETRVFVADLMRGMTGKDGRYVEYYGRFLEREGVLRRGFVGECIEPGRLLVGQSPTFISVYTERSDVPGERYLDVVLIHRKPQVEQFQLSIISVQQVPSRSAVLPGAPHVLPQPIQCRTFLLVALGVVPICSPNVSLQRGYPVDFVGLLQRHRDHGHLRGHSGGGRAQQAPARRLDSVSSSYSLDWIYEWIMRGIVGTAIERERNLRYDVESEARELRVSLW